MKDSRREAHDLKEVVAEQALELRLLKKSIIADGEDIEWPTQSIQMHRTLSDVLRPMKVIMHSSLKAASSVRH